MAMVNPPAQVSGDSCSCSAPSPSFNPRFEALSDDDLNTLELIYWIILNGLAPSILNPSYEAVQALLASCDCWTCLSARKRRELVISKMLNLSACLSTDTMWTIIRTLQRYTTRDQLQAALDCQRYQGIHTVNCGDIFPT